MAAFSYLLLLEQAWAYGRQRRPDFDAEVQAWREERPDRLGDAELLSEYAWVVAGAGLTYAACAKQHARLRAATGSWVPAQVAAAGPALAEVFRNTRKRTAIVDMADYLAEHPGEMARLAGLPLAEVHRELAQWPFVGATNRYQLIRNLGFDEVARSGPVVRLAAMLGLDSPALCNSIAAESGERLRVVDLVLWCWAEATTREEQWQCCQLVRLTHSSRAGDIM